MSVARSQVESQKADQLHDLCSLLFGFHRFLRSSFPNILDQLLPVIARVGSSLVQAELFDGQALQQLLFSVHPVYYFYYYLFTDELASTLYPPK